MENINRQSDRIRVTLESLARRGVGEWGHRSDLWNEAAAEFPLSEWEQEELSSAGDTRGHNHWHWGIADFVEVGWVRRDPKGNGNWAITPAGVEALKQFEGDALRGEARRRYNEARARLREEIKSRLGSAWLPHDTSQRRVLAAQEVVVDQGFRAGESLFNPGRELWTQANLRAVRDLCRGTQKQAGQSFLESLAEVMADAPDDHKLLVAEVVTTQLLPFIGIGHARKFERVETMLNLMEHAVEFPRVFDEAFSGGSYHPGQFLISNVGESLSLILNVLVEWTALEQDAQEEMLKSPQAWRDFVYVVDGRELPTQRNSLLYLVHPTYFGPIVSAEHRLEAREAFLGEIGGVASEDPDEDLRRIMLSLQQKVQDVVDLYSKEWLPRWDGSSDGGGADSRPQEEGEGSGDTEESGVVVDERGFTPESVDTAQLSADLTFNSAWVERVVGALHRRGQTILYGPPGTGKTYAARKIAEALSGAGSTVKRIQFHPSYTYEDFFAGYRPKANADGQLVFELSEGPLRQIAEDAKANPEVPHVLLIDEINRANLSSVFGELYYLLEYRNDPIDVLYTGSGDDGGNTFSLPLNVLIIGTMNTADRSIALLDSAMRRRFSFFELHPDVPPVQGILDRFIAEYPQPLPIAELFEGLNAQIPERDDRIGPSHLLQKKPITEELLEGVWDENIIPLLEERYLGTEVDVQRQFGLQQLLAAVQQRQE